MNTNQILLGPNEKLIVVTVWDKDPKRWYNFHSSPEYVTDNQERGWWISDRFESYKKVLREMITTHNSTNFSIYRFILSLNDMDKGLCKKLGLKNSEDARENFTDRLYNGERQSPEPIMKNFAQIYLDANITLKKNLTDKWLREIKDTSQFYFYCKCSLWKNAQNDINRQHWQTTIGEDFIKRYHMEPSHMKFVKLTKEQAEKYYSEGPSTDFTLIGKGNSIDDANWLFAIGVESDPQKEALLMKYAFRSIIQLPNEDAANLESYKNLLKILLEAKQEDGAQILDFINKEYK